MKFNEINLPLVKDCLDVSPDRGTIRWKDRPISHFRSKCDWRRFNAKMRGKIAGKILRNRYCIVQLGGNHFYYHRIIWAVHNNKANFGELDHINGDPMDNRICNLREVDHYSNMKNKSLYKTNKSGHHGVRWTEERGKWRAQIRDKNGKMTHIGYYSKLDDAVSARKKHERIFGYHENHGCRDSHY